MPNPVVHFEVVGRDGPALQRFYREVFDWEVNADNPMAYGLVEAQGAGIGGGVGTALEEDAGPYVTVYIEVADLRAALDRVEALGGTVVMDVTTIPGMVTMAMFRDPEGNLIGLAHAEAPPAE